MPQSGPTNILEALKACRGKLVMLVTLHTNLPLTEQGFQDTCVGYVDAVHEDLLVILHVDERGKRRSYFQPSAVVCFHEVDELRDFDKEREKAEAEMKKAAQKGRPVSPEQRG